VGADVLEEAARQLAAEGAARKAAEGRVAELQRQLAEREAVEASFRSAEGGGPEVDEAVPEAGAVEEGDGDSGDEAVDGEDGADGEHPAHEEAPGHRTADEILTAYLSVDPAVRSTVSVADVAWAKDAKETAKLLQPAEPVVGDQSALFAAVQAQNASLLRLFEESARREAQLSDRLLKLEKEGDTVEEKEAQNREFIDPFLENDYYAGAAEHLLRKKGSEPSFDKKNWSHIAAVKSLEETRGRLEAGGKLLTAEGIAVNTSLEHLLTLANLGAELENISLAIAEIGGERFGDLHQQASKGERKFCEKPTDPNYLSICKLYNHILALQENIDIVRPRLSLVVLQHKVSELSRGRSGPEVSKLIRAYQAAEVAVFGEPLTDELPDFFSDVIKGVVEKALDAHQKAVAKSLSGQTRTSDGRFISNFSRAAVGRFGATSRSWNMARGGGSGAQTGASRAAQSSGTMVVRA